MFQLGGREQTLDSLAEHNGGAARVELRPSTIKPLDAANVCFPGIRVAATGRLRTWLTSEIGHEPPFATVRSVSIQFAQDQFVCEFRVESHPYNESMDGSTGNANERIRHAGRHNLGTRSVSRMGYGAVRLTGPHVFGPPGDQARALSVCERPPAAKLDTTRRLQQALKRGPLRSQADLHRSTGDGIGEDNAA
jgi:hypothetical protein